MAYISTITLPNNSVYSIKAEKDTAGNTISTYYEPKANVTSKGTSSQPVYFDSSGVATGISYTINKSVPSDAEFTDTKNTAGSTDSANKLYLVGATSQATNPQTYSDSETYVTEGAFRTRTVTLVDKVRLEYSDAESCLNFVFS